MVNKVKLAPPVIPNVGVRYSYERKIRRELLNLHRECMRKVKAAYKESGFALDAAVFSWIKSTLKKLVNKWTSRFRKTSPDMAKEFVEASQARASYAMWKGLRNSGVPIDREDFRLTKPVLDTVQAHIVENTSLIRSIAADHLKDVQVIVMQAVINGWEPSRLADALQAKFGISERRAVNLANDQIHKVTESIVRIRRMDLGIERAVWLHAEGVGHPRVSHQRFSGKAYDCRQGAYIDGEYIQPGQLPYCHCTSRSILPPMWSKK